MCFNDSMFIRPHSFILYLYIAVHVTADASDMEDTQDLATALQEVRIYENQLATKSKKRRLERKQTSSNREVSNFNETEFVHFCAFNEATKPSII